MLPSVDELELLLSSDEDELSVSEEELVGPELGAKAPLLSLVVLESLDVLEPEAVEPEPESVLELEPESVLELEPESVLELEPESESPDPFEEPPLPDPPPLPPDPEGLPLSDLLLDPPLLESCDPLSASEPLFASFELPQKPEKKPDNGLLA